jgi:hypothetical protein
LPYEAVFASQHKGSGLLDEIEAVCSLYESQGVGFSSVQGPVANVLAHYSPPTEATAQDMANQRFGLFFELAKDNRT